MKEQTWYFKNIEHAKAYQKEYRLNNKAKFAANGAKRRASLKKATPKDLKPDQLSDIENLYKYTSMLSKFSGVEHQIDQPGEIKRESNTGMAIRFIATDLVDQEDAAPVNEHVPGAYHRTIGFPLDGHIVHHVIPEIGEDP